MIYMEIKMKQINVLFIVPSFPARTYPGKTMAPDYLAGILLKKGCSVEILDLDILGTKRLDEELSKQDYDLIGISYLSFQTDVTMEIAEKCHKVLSKKGRRKPNFPNYTPIIVGGVGATWCNGIVPLYPYIDAFCIGESFVTILEVADSINKGKFLKDRKKIKGLIYFDKQSQKVVQTQKRPLVKNIDKYIPLRLHFYPSYNFTVIFGDKKTAQMMTQIGCPYCCVFCGEGTKGPLIRKRSLESIEKELEILMKEDYRAIYFDDSTFTYDRKRTLQIISLMKKVHKRHGVIWGFNTRIDCLDEEVLTKMKESGAVYMFAGVESLVPEVLAGMNKVIPGLNKDYPPLVKSPSPEDYAERARTVYKIMGKLGIETSCFLIFGGPKKIVKDGKIKMTVESFEDAKKSIDTAVFELNPEYISINIMRFIPDAIMSFAEPYAVIRGQKEPFTGGYFSSKYRKKYKIKKRGFNHLIYLAFEAASDFYPIPPHLTSEYCYKILRYLVDQVNDHNKNSKIKTKIWVDEEFEKFMPRDKNGIYHLVPFEKIKKSHQPPTLHRRFAPPCPR